MVHGQVDLGFEGSARLVGELDVVDGAVENTVQMVALGVVNG
jgi:hypothetical protein